MRSKRLTWLVTLLGTVIATSMVGCRTRQAAHEEAVSPSTKQQPVQNETPLGSAKAPSAAANNARLWIPPLTSMAVTTTGIPWATGRIQKPFDFGSGAVAPSENGDIYLTKIDPMTCLASSTFLINGTRGKDLVSDGIAVASGGNVGIIGSFTGEIDFTDRNADGSGPGGQPGVPGKDFLQTGASVPFYAVLDGASTGAHVTPIKAHLVAMGHGRLLSIASNPSQDAFAICGRTDKAVPAWSDAAASKGVITGGNAVAGGDWDILVAKIDAATGAVIWGKQFGGAGDQVCDSVAIDNSGDVIIAGGYSGTLSFGRIALPTTANTPDLALLYVAKLNRSTGAVMAARTWGGAGRMSAHALTVDAKSNIVVAGALGGNIDFGSGISVNSYGLTDAFVVKLNPRLAPVWAKSYGDSQDQAVKSVGVSSRGNVFIGGWFQSSLGALGLTSAGKTTTNAFTAELSGTHGDILAAHAYGDSAGTHAVHAVTVARTATGSLADSTFIGGSFWGTITFGSTSLTMSSPPRSLASYLARVVP